MHSLPGGCRGVGASAYAGAVPAEDPAARLAERERELTALLVRLDEDDASLRADRADQTADDEHDPEGSTLSGEWQRVAAVRSATARELDDVRAALALVAAGTYGVCERCGRPIPPARLEARPQATRCVACASLL
ncbi:MAG TPA: molecular chaperone DnaK [Microbacterium sp.]|nr:molecular chaperone DnaK [Microbacterium sp.]